MSRDLFLQVFFMNHLPQGLKITVRSFHTFLKIRGDIPNSRRTTNSMTPAINLPSVLLMLVAPGGKFATGVNDTAGNLGTVSDCLHLKVNLKKKIYLYVNSLLYYQKL